MERILCFTESIQIVAILNIVFLSCTIRQQNGPRGSLSRCPDQIFLGWWPIEQLVLQIRLLRIYYCAMLVEQLVTSVHMDV